MSVSYLPTFELFSDSDEGKANFDWIYDWMDELLREDNGTYVC